jgi:CRISPR-associated endonuclease/helicase Cas3
MSDKFIAHVRKNNDGTWAPPHMLLDHLEKTAETAEKNAAKFQSGSWGKAAGAFHDTGKARLVWYDYIQRKSGYYDKEAQVSFAKLSVWLMVSSVLLLRSFMSIFGKSWAESLP